MNLDWTIEAHDCLASTMDEAHSRISCGAPSGTVIVTKSQTKGRGRQGNSWEEADGNLYFSAIIRNLSQDHRHIGQYAFLAAVALKRATATVLSNGQLYSHKWPNDGLLNDKKFAGILLEVSDDALIIGVGVNVKSAPNDRICLQQVSDIPITAKDFLDRYLNALKAVLAEYKQQGFSKLRQEWLQNAQGLNTNITARLAGQTLEGVFHGLDENGALLLNMADGSQKVIHSGEVFIKG